MRGHLWGKLITKSKRQMKNAHIWPDESISHLPHLVNWGRARFARWLTEVALITPPFHREHVKVFKRTWQWAVHRGVMQARYQEWARWRGEPRAGCTQPTHLPFKLKFYKIHKCVLLTKWLYEINLRWGVSPLLLRRNNARPSWDPWEEKPQAKKLHVLRWMLWGLFL